MKILIVLTSHEDLANTGNKTCFSIEEFASPFYVLKDAGADIILASPRGGQPPIDPQIAVPGACGEATKRFQKDTITQELLANTKKLTEDTPSNFKIHQKNTVCKIKKRNYQYGDKYNKT